MYEMQLLCSHSTFLYHFLYVVDDKYIRGLSLILHVNGLFNGYILNHPIYPIDHGFIHHKPGMKKLFG